MWYFLQAINSLLYLIRKIGMERRKNKVKINLYWKVVYLILWNSFQLVILLSSMYKSIDYFWQLGILLLSSVPSPILIWEDRWWWHIKTMSKVLLLNDSLLQKSERWNICILNVLKHWGSIHYQNSYITF